MLPFAFSLCSVGFLYGLFDRRPEELGAIDRHAAVEGMDEGWIVLDVHDTIMDMNAAAERMTGYSRADVFGRPISSLLGDLSNLGLTLGENQEVELKRSIQLEEGWRSLNIRISTLMDFERSPMGRLTLWRDMTESKQSEEARQRARDEMFVMLNAISSAASNTLSTEEFLLESIYHFIYPFRSQVVGIFLVDDRSRRRGEGRLQLSSHLGLPEEAIEELALRADEFASVSLGDEEPPADPDIGRRERRTCPWADPTDPCRLCAHAAAGGSGRGQRQVPGLHDDGAQGIASIQPG